jgi:4-amino-4-deoxy-L-arabinose transferase-like glycosyltransferase
MSDLPKLKRSPSRSNLLALVLCVACIFSFAVISFRSWLDKSAAFDEPLHFVSAWLQTHYGEFRCNPEDPPLWKYYIAVGTNKDDLQFDFKNSNWTWMLRAIPGGEVLFTDKVLYQTAGNNPDELLRAAHARMVALGVVLAAAIAWWAWRLAGPVAGVVAVAAFAFDPNFLANTPVVKNDVPITLLFVLLMGVVWLAGERATVWRCAAIILIVAAAVMTKFSGLLALPLLSIALFCRAMLSSSWPFLRWNLSTRLRRLVASVGLVFGCVLFTYFATWACYQFRFGPSPDPDIKFDFKQPILDIAENEMQLSFDPVPTEASIADFNKWILEWKGDPVVSIGRFINAHHLLPQACLYGFLYTYGTSMARRAFLCGDIRIQGWWYYFPLAMLFKTPLATLIALAASAVFCVALVRRSRVRDAWPIFALGAAPVFYMVTAMRSNLNIGLRHVLPVYPFLFIFIGVMAATALARYPKTTGCLMVLLLGGLLGETLAAYPNFIPFFNVAAGGSSGGIRLLSDANLDWGQDLPALARWQREHPDHQLYLSQFGLPDPRYYGIPYIEMGGAGLSQDDEKVPNGLPPVYAISAVNLQGTYIPAALYHDVYERFKKMKPFEVLNGTIYLFKDPVPQPP